jgi:hypothetical protein
VVQFGPIGSPSVEIPVMVEATFSGDCRLDSIHMIAATCSAEYPAVSWTGFCGSDPAPCGQNVIAGEFADLTYNQCVSYYYWEFDVLGNPCGPFGMLYYPRSVFGDPALPIQWSLSEL